MDTTTVFITRYVADHAEGERWYAELLGRPADHEPVPNCREWQLRSGVYLQVIHDPAQAGTTTFAFGVADLAGESRRLEAAGMTTAVTVEVDGFDDLQWLALTDPEGVETGLLNESGIVASEADST